MTDRENSEEKRLAAADLNAENADSERLEMRLPASAEWVRVVRLATAGVASRVGFSYDEVEDIKLAVAEACNNAIIHSTSDASTPHLTVFWQVLPDGVRISVSDEGRLSPPGLPRRKPSTPADENADSAADLPGIDLPESGMGLLLIENLMDEVEHESGPDCDTTIHMTKRIAPNLAPRESNPAPRPHPDSPVSLRPSKNTLGAKPSTPGASQTAR